MRGQQLQHPAGNELRQGGTMHGLNGWVVSVANYNQVGCRAHLPVNAEQISRCVQAQLLSSAGKCGDQGPGPFTPAGVAGYLVQSSGYYAGDSIG